MEEDAGKRRIRGLYIVKSRGMGHSSDVHKLILSDGGIDIVSMDAAAGATNQTKQADKSISEREKMSKSIS